GQRAPVVPQALPFADHIGRGCGRERLDRRPALQPVLPAGQDALQLRLLRHDFGDEDRVRVTRPPPRQVASVLGAPGEPQHLHVGIGRVRPPFRRDWVSGGTSLVEFPPAIGFHYLYYASLNGNLDAVSTRNGRRLWTVHIGRCEASSPAVDRLGRGSVYE